MSLTTSNPFAPLADYNEDDNKMDDGSPTQENVDGWADDFTVSSNDSKPGFTSTELQDKKTSAKKKQLKAMRKQKKTIDYFKCRLLLRYCMQKPLHCLIPTGRRAS
jgi:hypothetical protein